MNQWEHNKSTGTFFLGLVHLRVIRKMFAEILENIPIIWGCYYNVAVTILKVIITASSFENKMKRALDHFRANTGSVYSRGRGLGGPHPTLMITGGGGWDPSSTILNKNLSTAQMCQ